MCVFFCHFPYSSGCSRRPSESSGVPLRADRGHTPPHPSLTHTCRHAFLFPVAFCGVNDKFSAQHRWATSGSCISAVVWAQVDINSRNDYKRTPLMVRSFSLCLRVFMSVLWWAGVVSLCVCVCHTCVRVSRCSSSAGCHHYISAGID